jgi:hypothetical protein
MQSQRRIVSKDDLNFDNSRLKPSKLDGWLLLLLLLLLMMVKTLKTVMQNMKYEVNIYGFQ